MARWHRLGMMTLILLVVWGWGKGQTMTEVNPGPT